MGGKPSTTQEQQQEHNHHRLEHAVERVFGHVVNPIIECMDVDGVVRRINVNHVVERIDLNAMLDRVDINRQIERVDVNAVMRRIDLDEVMERSDLAAIVAQSSSGVFTGLMDSCRIQIVRIDLMMLRVFQLNQRFLPPAPGDEKSGTTRVPYPDTTMEKAIAVQKHYCGIFSKILAFLFDSILLSVLLALITIAVDTAQKRIDKLFIHSEGKEQKAEETEELWVEIVTALVWVLYFWVSVGLSGHTVGMAIAGVCVVQTNGDSDVSMGQAAIRTVFLAVTVFTWPITIWVGVVRRDGRMLHDIVACTGMIYRWNARMATLREKSIMRRSASGQDKEDLNP